MRETAADKARRLLLEGRVMIRHVDHTGYVHAQVRGDSGEVYDAGHDPRNNEWRCTCAELKGNCSHLQAVKLVVVIA